MSGKPIVEECLSRGCLPPCEPSRIGVGGQYVGISTGYDDDDNSHRVGATSKGMGHVWKLVYSWVFRGVVGFTCRLVDALVGLTAVYVYAYTIYHIPSGIQAVRTSLCPLIMRLCQDDSKTLVNRHFADLFIHHR